MLQPGLRSTSSGGHATRWLRGENQRLTDELDKVAAEAKKLRAALTSHKIESQCFKSAFEAIQNSRSWRITKPYVFSVHIVGNFASDIAADREYAEKRINNGTSKTFG